MDKFVVSLPRNSSGRKVGKGRADSASPGTVTGVAVKAHRTFGKASAPAPALKQTFLDLGQRSFGATSSCTRCGMLYVLGDIDDEQRHKAYCGRADDAPSLPANAAKGLRVLDATGDDAAVGTTITGAARAASAGAAGSSILEVRWAERHKLEQGPLHAVLEHVQGQLGSTQSLMEGPDESVLLLVRAHKVVACAVRQAVSSRALVSLSLKRTSVDVDVDVKTTTVSDPNNDDDSEEEKARRPPGDTLGIKLIWVHCKCRHSGLASRILDAARKTFEFGRIVKKEHVAYSQPTEDGLGLFLAYSKQDSIWGYC